MSSSGKRGNLTKESAQNSGAEDAAAAVSRLTHTVCIYCCLHLTVSKQQQQPHPLLGDELVVQEKNSSSRSSTLMKLVAVTERKKGRSRRRQQQLAHQKTHSPEMS